MNVKSKNSFKSLDKLDISGKTYHFYNLLKAEKNGLKGINKLPKSLKVLLENLLRFEDGVTVNQNQIKGIADWLKTKNSKELEKNLNSGLSLFSGVFNLSNSSNSMLT